MSNYNSNREGQNYGNTNRESNYESNVEYREEVQPYNSNSNKEEVAFEQYEALRETNGKAGFKSLDEIRQVLKKIPFSVDRSRAPLGGDRFYVHRLKGKQKGYEIVVYVPEGMKLEDRILQLRGLPKESKIGRVYDYRAEYNKSMKKLERNERSSYLNTYRKSMELGRALANERRRIMVVSEPPDDEIRYYSEKLVSNAISRIKGRNENERRRENNTRRLASRAIVSRAIRKATEQEKLNAAEIAQKSKNITRSAIQKIIDQARAPYMENQKLEEPFKRIRRTAAGKAYTTSGGSFLRVAPRPTRTITRKEFNQYGTFLGSNFNRSLLPRKTRRVETRPPRQVEAKQENRIWNNKPIHTKNGYISIGTRNCESYSKDELMNLCTKYRLETSGTKAMMCKRLKEHHDRVTK
jgi:hypothetical protein